ncbi:MAG: C45 family peptidase [Halioglobus sp.]
MPFTQLTVSGSAKQRGAAVGEALRAKIANNCEFYEQQFYPLGGASVEAVVTMAAQVEGIISAFRPELSQEIRAMAEAANIDPMRLFALNARTEILNALNTQECTSLYAPAKSVLAQTWDWVDALESGTVLIQHQLESGFEFLTLTEAGILGKIGFNSGGLGVCLNILSSPHHLSGLPVHITARAVLETPLFTDIHPLLERVGAGKASHLLIADDNGSGLSVEWAGQSQHIGTANAGGFCHSNHYIAQSIASPPAPAGNSAERLSNAQSFLAQNPAADAATVFEFLKTDNEINHDYMPLDHFHGLNIGTVATIVMDLPNRAMHIRRGPGSEPRAGADNIYRLGTDNAPLS